MNKRAVYRVAGIFFFIALAGIVDATGLDVTIRFYNQEVYTTDSEIHIRISIRNSGSETASFRLSDQRQFNIDFDVRTTENMPVNPSREYLATRTRNQPIFFREVYLEPGEEYAFTERLDSYVELSSPGVFHIQATFKPMLSSSPEPQTAALQSNRLVLSLRPPLSRLEEAMIKAEQETVHTLLRRDLSPDQTVRETIEARQQQQWERFFLYIDVESIMLRNPRLERQFRNSSAQERSAMIDRYRDLMRELKSEDDILQIPQEYRVLQTEYTPSSGSVVVEKQFRYPTYTEIREYTYFVHRVDRYWQIYDYSVRNLGTTE